MNREIKFRGKRIDNGEWVYGWYYKTFDEYSESIIISLVDDHDYLVHPDTVGQYTGLHDKNGKEIYEGDKVKWGKDTRTVEWFNGGFIYRLNERNWSLANNWVEVIGTIHKEQ